MATGLLQGLAQFKAEKARQEQERAEREKPRANWFNWNNNKNKDDKSVIFVRFLQEFDKDVPGYNENYGLPVSLIEHQAPGKKGYTRRASCTAEDSGQCYACERHAEDIAQRKLEAPGPDGKKRQLKGWGQRRNFYTWALVDYNDGDGVVPVIISRPFGSSFVDDLIMEVEDADDNKITDKMWRVTRTGSGKQTAWKLKEAKGVDLYDDTDLELPDLKSSAERNVAYNDQPAYYGAVYKEGDALDGDDEPDEPKAERKESGELSW
jgi:hypothetical protein